MPWRCELEQKERAPSIRPAVKYQAGVATDYDILAAQVSA